MTTSTKSANVTLKPIEVPKALQDGEKFMKWDEDSGQAGLPVTLRVDAKGFFLYWTDQNMEVEMLDIATIRDVRTGIHAKIPKDQKIRNVVLFGSQGSLEEKTVTVCYGADFVNVTFINFCCTRKEIAQMPLSSAERCRKYREKLKKDNPEKFEQMKRKNAERTKAKKRKISDMNEEEKKDTRQQWRDYKLKKIQKIKDPTIEKAERSLIEAKQADRSRRRFRSQVTRENMKLKEKIRYLSKRNNRLRKALSRSKKKVHALTFELDEIKSKNSVIPRSRSNSKEKQNTTSISFQDSNELTPLTKSNSFVEEELKEISQEAKDKVKQKLLQQHVLEASLKETYKDSKQFQERQILKKIVESETAKKYNMKKNLTKCLGLKSDIRSYRVMKQKKGKTIGELQKFYNRDDNSRMTAGKREYVTYKKIQKQKRYLLNTLKKLYKKYRSEGGGVSFTTFKRYRPFYVVSPKITTRNTCACLKHANLAFKVEALKKLGLIKTADLTDLVSEIVCDVTSKNCMYSECKICSDKKLTFDDTVADGQQVSWFEWTTKTHEYDKNDEHKVTKRIVKEKRTDVLSTLKKLVQDELQRFKSHNFNIFHQYKEYKRAIDNIQDNEVILHCDFSENYICKLAEEVQSMHFGASKTQITLHTGVLYINNKKPISFCTVSPSLKHGPEAIWGHLKPVMDFVKESFPTIDRIHFWSDGPTTQYRQKKNFILFCEKTKELGFNQATWSFFEASHGKGAADGVGGAIKRTLDARVAYGEDIVDAKSAFDFLSKTETSIKIFYVSEQDIEQIIISSPKKILAVPSTMKIHQAIVTENKHIVKYRPLSCFCTRGSCECFATKTHSLRKTIQENTTTRRTRTKSLDSSDNTDTEIQYAESDSPDWHEAINSTNSEEQETHKEKIENKETRPGTNIQHNLSIKVLTEKQTANSNKENKGKGVTVLADVRNTPENLAYFDLRSYGKLTLTSICSNQRLDIKRKEEKDNVDHQTKPIPSTSGIQTLRKQKQNFYENFDGYKKEQRPYEAHINDRNFEENGDDLSEVERKFLISDAEKPKVNKFTETEDKANINVRNVGKTDEKLMSSIIEGTIFINEKVKQKKNAFEDRQDETTLNERYVEKSDENLHTITSELEADVNVRNVKQGDYDLEAVSSEIEGEYIINDVENPKENDGKDVSEDDNLEERSSEVEGKILINDIVLVRYYVRKSWKYYVGFVDKIEIKDDETFYTVTFLKTVKTPKLKFIKPKKVDLDIITNVSIVKKIRISQQSKDFYLVNSFDQIYF